MWDYSTLVFLQYEFLQKRWKKPRTKRQKTTSKKLNPVLYFEKILLTLSDDFSNVAPLNNEVAMNRV